MLDQVHLCRSISVPQVDGEHVERCVDFTTIIVSLGPQNLLKKKIKKKKKKKKKPRACAILDIDFLLGLRILHNQPHTGRWSNRPAILMDKNQPRTLHLACMYLPCPQNHTYAPESAVERRAATRFGHHGSLKRVRDSRRSVADQQILELDMQKLEEVCDP